MIFFFFWVDFDLSLAFVRRFTVKRVGVSTGECLFFSLPFLIPFPILSFLLLCAQHGGVWFCLLYTCFPLGFSYGVN